MRQKIVKKVFIVCSIVLATFAMSVQKAEMIVCAEEYEYDDLNRIIKVTYEDGETVEYVYDSNGNIIETIVNSDESENSSGKKEEDERDNSSEEKQKDESATGTDKPTGASGVTLPDEPADSTETTKPTEAIKPVESEQSDSVRKIVEDVSYWLENLVEPFVYIENLLQRLTEFAKSLWANLGE